MDEYVVANQIADKPAFVWWVPYTLKRRNIIISKVKIKYWSTTNKYVVMLPNNVMEAMQINHANGNAYWRDTINKEVKKDKIDYKPR